MAQLAAEPPTALPTMQPLDATQSAQLKSLGDKSQAVATKMAPLMVDAEKIMAKCGDDEACLTREAQKMGRPWAKLVVPSIGSKTQQGPAGTLAAPPISSARIW